jgi:hypothetical protein
MQIKMLSVAIFSIVLTACASVTRTDVATNKIYPNIKAAVLDTKPLINVTYGEFVNVKIENVSPSVSGQKSLNKFEVVGLDGIKNQPFTIGVNSVCDCLGFKKWAVYPVAYLFDDSGAVIAQEKIGDPMSKILTGVFPADGHYKVLVIADNTNEGKKIGDAVGYMGAFKFSLAETVHPTGLIQVNWQKQK